MRVRRSLTQVNWPSQVSRWYRVSRVSDDNVTDGGQTSRVGSFRMRRTSKVHEAVVKKLDAYIIHGYIPHIQN